MVELEKAVISSSICATRDVKYRECVMVRLHCQLDWILNPQEDTLLDEWVFGVISRELWQRMEDLPWMCVEPSHWLESWTKLIGENEFQRWLSLFCPLIRPDMSKEPCASALTAKGFSFHYAFPPWWTMLSCHKQEIKLFPFITCF